MDDRQYRGSFVRLRRYQEIRGDYSQNNFNKALLREFMAKARHDQFTQSDLKGHFGCVNAIEFTWGRGDYIASGGDDRRVLLWHAHKALAGRGSPIVMDSQHNSNIFCITFDLYNRKIFSGGNDEQVLIHDIETGKLMDVYLHDDVVYGLSSDPNNDHVFASACDDGSALIYDTRIPNSDAFSLAKYGSPMHSIVYNPVEPRLLATANAKEGVGLWDVRKPLKPVMRYGSTVQQSCMNVRISQSGERIIAIRRRLPLVLYDIKQQLPLCEFDHQSYYNSCTMKSCSFAGEGDEYVLSGSDDFNVYMWRIPEDLSCRRFINSSHTILKGHRSIVNQVRSNPSTNVIISSGVEKIIKAWSPYVQENPNSEHTERNLYTHEEYINLILNSGQGMSHDYSQRSVEEEPRMMAFFDSLVQREIEGWSSDDELSSNDEELYQRIVQLSQSDSDSSHSSGDGERLSPFSRGFVTVMASRSLAENTPEGRLLNPQSFDQALAGIDGLETLDDDSAEINGSLNNSDIQVPQIDSTEDDGDNVNGDSTETVNSSRTQKTDGACCVGTTDSTSCVVNGETSPDSGFGNVQLSNSSLDLSAEYNNSQNSVNSHNSRYSSNHTAVSNESSTYTRSMATSEVCDIPMPISPLETSDVTPVPGVMTTTRYRRRGANDITGSDNIQAHNTGLVDSPASPTYTGSMATSDLHDIPPVSAIETSNVPGPVVPGIMAIPRRRRIVAVDITGTDINVQPLPGIRTVPANCRRRISQLISWRRENALKKIKSVARRLASPEDSSDDETSVSAVRAKVLRLGAGVMNTGDTSSNISSLRSSLRPSLIYSSEDDLNTSADNIGCERTHNSLNDDNLANITCLDKNSVCDNSDRVSDGNTSCDINNDLCPVTNCDHELRSTTSSSGSAKNHDLTNYNPLRHSLATFPSCDANSDISECATECQLKTSDAQDSIVTVVPDKCDGNRDNCNSYCDKRSADRYLFDNIDGYTEQAQPSTSFMAYSMATTDATSSEFPIDGIASTSVSATINTSVSDSVSGSVSGNIGLPEVDNGNSQPMWAEFKRFKSRMKKAQRYYRQHAKQRPKKSRHRSSSEDEDESHD